MTLDEIRAAAERACAGDRPLTDVEWMALATFVRDLMTMAPMTRPRIKGSMIRLAASNADLYLSASDARRLAGDLLRAAESTEHNSGGVP